MTKRPDASYNLCNFRFASGKFCTMPALPNHNGLCLNHATIHRRTFFREDDLLKELASPAGDFISQIDINHVLGKLFEALAANRISPQRAATLAYIPGALQTRRHQMSFRAFSQRRLRRAALSNACLPVANPIAQIPSQILTRPSPCLRALSSPLSLLLCALCVLRGEIFLFFLLFLLF